MNSTEPKSGKSSASLAVFVLLGGWLLLADTSIAATEWKAGVASVSINPPLPMWMSGYGNRPGPAKEITLELKAKALAIEHVSGERIVIVTTDLLGVPRVLRDRVAGEVARLHGLP